MKPFDQDYSRYLRSYTLVTEETRVYSTDPSIPVCIHQTERDDYIHVPETYWCPKKELHPTGRVIFNGEEIVRIRRQPMTKKSYKTLHRLCRSKFVSIRDSALYELAIRFNKEKERVNMQRLHKQKKPIQALTHTPSLD